MQQGQTLTTHQAAVALLGVLRAVDHSQRAELSHRERLELVEEFTKVASQVDGLRSVLVAEADAENSAMLAIGTPLTTFLARVGVQTAKQAAGEVFTAREVTGTPARQAAVLAGRIAPSQAKGISKAMQGLPTSLNGEQRRAVESELLSRAATTPGTELARQGIDAAKTACPEALGPHAEADLLEARARRAYRARALRFFDERDGSVEFTGSLPVVDATRFKNLLGARVEAARRSNPRSRDRHGFTTTPEQRQADALLELLDVSETSGHRAGRTSLDVCPPPTASTRARLVITISEEELRRRAVLHGVLAPDIQVPASELRRLACDAGILPVVLGSQSEVLDVGREHRLVTAGIRKALSVRDRGCIFPGCDAPDHRCEAHHVVPFFQGGSTALTNLVLLCPYHHALVEPPSHVAGDPVGIRWMITFDEHGNPSITQKLDRPPKPPPPPDAASPPEPPPEAPPLWAG